MIFGGLFNRSVMSPFLLPSPPRGEANVLVEHKFHYLSIWLKISRVCNNFCDILQFDIKQATLYPSSASRKGVKREGGDGRGRERCREVTKNSTRILPSSSILGITIQARRM